MIDPCKTNRGKQKHLLKQMEAIKNILTNPVGQTQAQGLSGATTRVLVGRTHRQHQALAEELWHIHLREREKRSRLGVAPFPFLGILRFRKPAGETDQVFKRTPRIRLIRPSARVNLLVVERGNEEQQEREASKRKVLPIGRNNRPMKSEQVCELKRSTGKPQSYKTTSTKSRNNLSILFMDPFSSTPPNSRHSQKPRSQRDFLSKKCVLGCVLGNHKARKHTTSHSLLPARLETDPLK